MAGSAAALPKSCLALRCRTRLRKPSRPGRVPVEDWRVRWIKYNKSAASLHDNLLRTCGHGNHNEFTESGGKIHTSLVSGGAVIHEDELADWSVASVSSNRITFKDGWGDIWHYDRCR